MGKQAPAAGRRFPKGSNPPVEGSRETRLKIYEYANCSTCRKALKFLDAKGVAYERVPIVERPPTQAELKRMLKAQGGNLKKLFNTSGLQYRELKLGEKLPSMTEEQAIRLLSENGKLVKRPFVLDDGFAAVGFDEKQWKQRLRPRSG